MRHDDHRLVEHRVLHQLATQVPHHTLCHVLHIQEALPQVGIIQAAQRVHVLAHQLVVGPVHTHTLLAYRFLGLLQNGGVLQNQQMRLEDLAFRAAQLPAHHALQFLDLLPRHVQRRMQPRHLGGHHVWHDAVLVWLVEVIFQHMHHRMCHPVGHGGTGPDFFNRGGRFGHVAHLTLRTTSLANAGCVKQPKPSPDAS